MAVLSSSSTKWGNQDSRASSSKGGDEDLGLELGRESVFFRLKFIQFEGIASELHIKITYGSIFFVLE